MKLFNFFSCCQNIVTFAIFNIAVMTLVSSPGWALVDASLEVGQRRAKWEQGSESSSPTSQVLRAAFHLDPIPLVPVSFGLGLYSETWSVNESDLGLTSLKSFSAVPEIVAWFPIDDFKPFGRLGYSIASGYSGKMNIVTPSGTTSGTITLAGVGLHAAAGLEYSIPLVPLLSVLGSVEYASERVRLAKDEVGSIDISGNYKTITLTSTAFLLGVKVGL